MNRKNSKTKIDTEGQECLEQFQLQWELGDLGDKLRRIFEFNSFAEAMLFANDVAAIAEEVGQYPGLEIGSRQVIVEVGTEGRGKLTEKDFRLAAKIDLVGGI